MAIELATLKTDVHQNGMCVDLWIVELTASNRDKGGEVLIQMTMSWQQANNLAIKLLNVASLAKSEEIELKESTANGKHS